MMHHDISVSPMRTTVTLDDDVFEAATALAHGSGQRLGQVLSMLARKGLTGGSDSSIKNGLPIFTVPVNAPIIPSSRASEIMADEDL